MFVKIFMKLSSCFAVLKTAISAFKSYKVIVTILLVFLCAAVAVLPTQLFSQSAASAAVLPSTSTSPQKQGYIEVRAIKNYGAWIPPNETTTDVLNMITEVRSATNMTLNLYAIVTGPQAPGQLIHGTTMTVDDFLVQAKKDAGGQVIPELNLNFYTSNIKSLALNEGNKFCNPENRSDCGPAWFYDVSEELIQLQAVATSNHKTVELDAWDQFNRDVKTAGLPADTPTLVLTALHTEGWQTILLKSENNFPDGGDAEGVVAPVNWQTTSPYMEPDSTRLSQIPSGQQAFIHFDRQIQNSPVAPTSLYEFLAKLTPSEQATALGNLAGLQKKDNYTFVYPMITYTSRNNITYYWDASLNLQSNGRPFLNLIESLLVSDAPET
jgi:hypothetical protein